MDVTRQIIKTNNKTKLIEFSDNMQPNDFSEETGVKRSTVHSKFSRIAATIVDWTKGKKDKAVVVQYNINPEVMKAIAHTILSGNLEDFQKVDKYSKKTGHFEQKINYYSKNSEGFSPVSSLNIRYQEQMNAPWTVTIENGVGIAEVSDIGGISIKRGTYKALHSSTVYLSRLQMAQVMLEVKNYIENFETVHMKKMLSCREQYEEKMAQKRNAQ